MKLYAPKYYLDFKCIADKCTHSCCIGWEIDVDDEALKLYESVSDGYGNEIRKSIDFSETPHFRLSVGERCPHLDDFGLCRIIKNLGEGFLCHICREHPRFYNNTSVGLEVGLGMACQEASRIVLSSDSFSEFAELESGENDCCVDEFETADFETDNRENESEKTGSEVFDNQKEKDDYSCEKAETDVLDCVECEKDVLGDEEGAKEFFDNRTDGENDFDALKHRKWIFELLLDDSLSYLEKLKTISEKYKISLSAVSDETWKNVISSLEYLDAKHKVLFLNYSSVFSGNSKYDKFLLRAFAYFVFRHCSESFDEYEFRLSLGFSLFCERLFFSVMNSAGIDNFEGIVEIARIISEELEYSEDNTEAIKMTFDYL